MIKEIKISTNAKATNFLKDFSPSFADFLERIIVFNPTKRMKIEDILNHEIVKAFHKP
jgi:serine/threonine protein kinase